MKPKLNEEVFDHEIDILEVEEPNSPLIYCDLHPMNRIFNGIEQIIIERKDVMIGIAESRVSIKGVETRAIVGSLEIFRREVYEQNWSTGGSYLDPKKIFWNDLVDDSLT